MTTLPAVTGARLIKALRKLGFAVIRVKGSHHFLPRRWRMSSPTLLAQLDAILVEVQKLRATLQTRHAVPKRIDYVAQLSGVLGPAASDELEFFRAHDLDWERFAS